MHSDLYKIYLPSPIWRQVANEKLQQADYKCERCQAEAKEVHHKHYESLGHESLNDLEALCIQCHILADEERRQFGRSLRSLSTEEKICIAAPSSTIFIKTSVKKRGRARVFGDSRLGPADIDHQLDYHWCKVKKLSKFVFLNRLSGSLDKRLLTIWHAVIEFYIKSGGAYWIGRLEELSSRDLLQSYYGDKKGELQKFKRVGKRELKTCRSLLHMCDINLWSRDPVLAMRERVKEKRAKDKRARARRKNKK